MMRSFGLFIFLVGCQHSLTVYDDGGNVDGTTDGALTSRAKAVDDTIRNNAKCTSLNNFYWEIGDVHGPLASGKVGILYDANSNMGIASASKIVFGSYVVQKFKDDLSQANFEAMRMRTGYVNLDYSSCVNKQTVADCMAAAGGQTASEVGMFHYNGGHFQNYAVELGLGPDDVTQLAADIGMDLDYSSPQLAAGVKTTPAMFAGFLRKILSGDLAIHDHLGEDAVCTLPSACPTATYSPVPEAWHYSWGHWVEDAPGVGDGAFSSPGAFGFYPWIDASKTYYGILARQALTGNPAVESVECGRLMRKAFLTGQAQ